MTHDDDQRTRVICSPQPERQCEMKRQTAASLSVISFVLIVADAWGAVQYSVTDLGTLGGTEIYMQGINNNGQIVGSGSFVNQDAKRYAFLHSGNGPLTPADSLGTFGGPQSFGQGINASGQVVGFSYTNDNSGMPRAFLHSGSSPLNFATDYLGTLGGTFSEAFGVNNSGQVVGNSDTATFRIHAFRTSANRPINPATDDLGTLGGQSSEAWGINNSGQVVGDSEISGSSARHAFRTAANQPINPATDDLGTLGGAFSIAWAINDSGQVVGAATTSDGSGHAFRTAANQLINPATDDLGTLGGTGSDARAINSSGKVVGHSYTSQGVLHAFLFAGSGPMQDLNSLIAPASGWTLQYASAISDLGQIVGTGISPSGQKHAFLLTPVTAWNGSGENGNWSNFSNWTNGMPLAGTEVQFGALSGIQTTAYNDLSSGSYKGIRFQTDAAAYALTGLGISLSGPITNESGNDQAINLPINLVSGASSGTFDTGVKNITVGAAISGIVPVTKLGAGTLILGAANTFTSDTAINAGVIRLGHVNALQHSTVNVNVNLGLDVNGLDANIGGLAGSGNVNFGSASVTVGGNNSTTTYSGAIGGSGASLTKAGSGVLTLSVANTYSGATNFNGGLISASALNRLGTGTALNFDGGGLRLTAAFDPSVRTMTFYAGGATIDTAITGRVTLAHSVGNGGAGGLTKAGIGKLLLNAANNYNGGTTVQAGTLQIGHENALPVGKDLSIASDATAMFLSNLPKAVQLGGLAIDGGAAPTGTFDVANNSLILDQSLTPGGVSRVRDQLTSGYNLGSWDGLGIVSSTASADSRGVTAVGYLLNGDLNDLAFGTWFGRTVNNDSILIRYTYYGDADLNGEATTDDFDQWKQGYVTHGTGWFFGDFDYNGEVNTDDFDLWKQAYVGHYAPLGDGSGSGGGVAASAVPEPSVLVLLGLGGCGLLGRVWRKWQARES